MVEVLIVIGIVGVLVSVGTASYISQLNRTRVESATLTIQSNLLQARQMAIAMRQSRRVVIDAGHLEGFSESPPQLSGARSRRVSVWIEGKRCEEFNYEADARYLDPSGKTPNAYAVTDVDFVPDFVMIADVDGRTPGLNNPEIFYIEFNTRGAIGKVCFDKMESKTNYNEIAPVIHLARDSELYTVSGKSLNYTEAARSTTVKFKDMKSDARERYKVHTLEVVRLTGRMRKYDFGILNPWPLDEPVK